MPPAMICAKCPDRTSYLERREHDVRIWLETAATGCPSCGLFCDVLPKVYNGEVQRFAYAATAVDTYSQVFTSNLTLEFRTLKGNGKSINFYTDDERVSNDYPYITKVDYAIDPKFFTRTGVEGARMWLDHCLSSHPKCGGYDTMSPLPTRLVAVGSSTQNPRLHITESGDKGVYATLSYCWGKSQTFETTKSTLNQRLKGFSLGQLPKLCQDAILATRALGIMYIWIDQICIIQDEPKDWAHQAANMNSIYSNSLLTLAALASPGANTGFKIYDSSEELTRSNIATEIQLLDGTKGAVYGKREMLLTKLGFIHSPFPPFDSEAQRPTAYLESRLWTLQEVVLSPRLLWFGHDDMGWSCKEATACECAPNLIPATLRQLPPHLAADIAPGSQRHAGNWLPVWYSYIEEATQRLVTVQSDRLPAVAGLAAAMKYHIGGRYIAGHWEVDIEKSLLWEILDEEDFRYRGTTLLPPMDQNYAPSWSWASVSRPMTHSTALIPNTMQLSMACKVLGIDFRPSTSNIYGPGIGILTMDAVVLAVKPPEPIYGTYDTFEHRTSGKQLKLRAGQRTWRPDPRGDDKPVHEKDLYLAIHARWPEDAASDEWGFLWSLVLEKVDEPELKTWKARFNDCIPQDSSQPEAAAGNPEYDAKARDAGGFAGDVFRRIGCVDSLFLLSEVSWEELVEEHKRPIQII